MSAPAPPTERPGPPPAGPDPVRPLPAPGAGGAAEVQARPRSTYEGLLRLHHLHLPPWQRESLTWGMVVLGVLLAMTGLVSPWVIVVLPLAVAASVKVQDALTPYLDTTARGLDPAPDSDAHPGPETTKPPVG